MGKDGGKGLVNSKAIKEIRIGMQFIVYVRM
jgi:hypothetical protein